MIEIVLTAAAGIIVGVLVAFVVIRTITRNQAQSIVEEAKKEAEVIKKNKLLEVKEKFLHLKADMEKQANARNAKIQSAEAKIKQRELQLNQLQQDLQRKKTETDAIRTNLDSQLDLVDKKKTGTGTIAQTGGGKTGTYLRFIRRGGQRKIGRIVERRGQDHGRLVHQRYHG